MLTNELDTLARLLAAVEDVASLDADVWYMNAGHFTHTEVTAFADLLAAAGRRDTAKTLLEQWIEEEIQDGEAVAGDYVFDEFTCRLYDHRIGVDTPSTAR